MTKLNYSDGISAETVGSERLCMKLVTIPPGGKSNAHLHERHETAVYVLSGEGATWFGEGLREHISSKAGEFMYIPANMPHLTNNPSAIEPCIAVIARTDPNDQESVTEYQGCEEFRFPRAGYEVWEWPPSRLYSCETRRGGV